MCVELKLNNITFERQKVYPLRYKNQYIGGYIADLVVGNKVILQNHVMILHSLARGTRLPHYMSFKSGSTLNPAMEAQLINYLK